jgi:two-component system cell cycle response regulator
VNNQIGYVAGDRLLRQIGTLIGNLVRGEDVIGRYSGDQFCVLLPETSLLESDPALHRIAGVISNTEFAVLGVDEPLHVAMKAGIASHELGDTSQTLIARARDNALGT